MSARRQREVSARVLESIKPFDRWKMLLNFLPEPSLTKLAPAESP